MFNSFFITIPSVSWVIENILNPFTVGAFSVLGGATPFVLLLFIYSKKRKRKLLKFIDFLKNSIEQTEIYKRKDQEQFTKFIAQSGDVIGIIDSNLSDADKKISIDILQDLRKRIHKFEMEISKNRSLIFYIEEYNFWTVIEDLLHRQYISNSWSERVKS